MADDEKGIDPRYDPAFQRGYQESDAKVPFLREPAASVPTVSVAEVDAGTETDTNPDADDTEIEGARRREIPPLRANPYVYALGVMGVFFVLGGVGIEIAITFGTFSQNGYQSTPAESMIAQNVGYVLTGPLITVGLAILAGLLFFTGSRWRSRRSGITP